jgi:phage repressor protein C with HTH and peptisase S24 domain
MEPTYIDGDWLLVTWFRAKNSGLISKDESAPFVIIKTRSTVVIELERQPGIYFVKRVAKIENSKYWLSSDNPAGTDSRTWGWVEPDEIIGKVLFRYYRKRRNR